jgi:hypothetical protein
MQIRKARLADIAEIETMIARSVMELHYAAQRPTMRPKIGSANGDATGSQ